MAPVGAPRYGAPAGAVAPAAPGAVAAAPAQWHPDPLGRYTHRYFDGANWTSQVSANGVSAVDPLGIAPTPVAAPPPPPPPPPQA